MGEFSSGEALTSALASDAEAGAIVFGIDGSDGSGKSTLAGVLSANLGWPVISLDSFLRKNEGEYVSHLDYEALTRAISSTPRPIIIEGVCLLDVADRLRLKLDRHIYVKRLSPAGHWPDADECDFHEPVENILAKIEDDIRAVNAYLAGTEGNPSDSVDEDVALTPFRMEVIRYHAIRKPSRAAHHLFAWREPDA